MTCRDNCKQQNMTICTGQSHITCRPSVSYLKCSPSESFVVQFYLGILRVAHVMELDESKPLEAPACQQEQTGVSARKIKASGGWM